MRRDSTDRVPPAEPHSEERMETLHVESVTYVIPPDIPAGMTVAEYRRRRKLKWPQARA